MSNENDIKKLDVSISEDNVKKVVNEFLTKNKDKVNAVTGGTGFSQQVNGWCLAAVMAEVFALDGETEIILSRNDLAKFFQQESLHGLAGNASQFKQWYFGK